MIKMKRTYLLVLILFLSVSLSAQKDKQAREILDKTANALQQAGGIRATFGDRQWNLIAKRQPVLSEQWRNTKLV